MRNISDILKNFTLEVDDSLLVYMEPGLWHSGGGSFWAAFWSPTRLACARLRWRKRI